MLCAVCGSPMAGPRHGHYFRCPACRFQASDLTPGLHDPQAHAALDEGARREGLHGLRQRNFDRILDAIEPLRAQPAPRLLDIGSAHGWFLAAASARGYDVTGLEPDAGILAANRGGHRVIQGLFPQDLPAGERFDVITFHDVFEHLPGPAAVLRACAAALEPGGLLVLNLPSSRGPLFRAAQAFAAMGWRQPLDRLWQRTFPSPHLSYFDPPNLSALLGRHGFQPVAQVALPALERQGLWQRLRLDRRGSLPAAALAWVALQCALPVLRRLPSDAIALVFRQNRVS
jgi:SAM-dependent methyltransferase